MTSLGFKRRNGESSALGRATGFVAVGLVALLVWLSADPGAHEHFHRDADRTDHRCIITEFAVGQGYYVIPGVIAPPQWLRDASGPLWAVAARHAPTDYFLLPSCGPPLGGR